MTFNLYKTMGTSASKEVEGVWYSPWGPVSDGKPGFKLARAGGANKNYEQAVAQGIKPYNKMINIGMKTQDKETMELLRKITMDAFVRFCVKGWENIVDSEEQTQPFSVENVRKLFEDLPMVFDDLFNFASDHTNYQDRDVELESKN